MFTWENYQAVKDQISIEIVGLTVITGPSNRGKSGLIRGLISALDNEKGYHFVHKGQEEARIKIENNAHSIQWIKGPKTSAYYIDGRLNPKSGRSTPKEDITKLGFFELVVQDQIFRPQIQSQFDKPFILSEASPVAAAGLLAASKHGQIIAKAIKSAQKDLSDKNTEVSLRERTLENLQSKIEKTNGFEQALQVALTKVLLSEGELQVIKNHLEVLQTLQSRYHLLKKRLSALELRPTVPPPDPPRLGNASTLHSLLQRFQFIKHQLQATSLSSTKAPPKAFSSGLVDQVAKLVKFRDQWIKLKRILKGAPLHPFPDTKKVAETLAVCVALRWTHRKYQEALTQLNESQSGLVDVAQNLVELDQENLDLLKALGVCPVCKQEICQDNTDHQSIQQSTVPVVGTRKRRRSL